MTDKPQLFLLHFAGGNRYSFQFLLPWLDAFDVIPLELPGRGKRIGEPILRDFESAAADIFRQLIRQLSGRDFLLYGHSMGAYLALRVAEIAEKQGRYSACLIVSGNAGPGIKNEKKRYLLDSEEFMKELDRLGGISRELKENPELFDFFEPVIRADFQIAESSELLHENPVKAPLYAIMGSEEEEVEKIANWAAYTTSRFDYSVLEGDHFFIHRHPERVARIIHETYLRSRATKAFPPAPTAL